MPIDLADCYIRVSSGLNNVATAESDPLAKWDFFFQKLKFYWKISKTNLLIKKRFLAKISDYFEVARKTEGRVSSDTDLKLSDTLRYYMRDSKAALDLLYRRTRRLADFETENKNLDKARLKHKDEKQAEAAQQIAKQKFENISQVARTG